MLDEAKVNGQDVILEIGPGTGYLTELLAGRAQKVVAIEKDEALAATLVGRWPNVEVIVADVLKYNLRNLPKGYKLVANIPYYLTSRLLRILFESLNPPGLTVLMMQKEVAERIVAKPPRMSLLSISAQYFTQPRLIQSVPKELFWPVPKVDSAIISFTLRAEPLFKADSRRLFRLVRAGFSSKRKQIKNSLAAGLGLPIKTVTDWLVAAGIDSARRAETLTLADWQKLYQLFSEFSK